MELWDTLVQLVTVLGRLLVELLQLGLHGALLIAWVAWWLLGVNWQKAWPVLRQGGWVPGVLLVFIAALAWSRIAPGPCECLGFVSVPNFWWQLGGVSLIAAVALFCGWLQGKLGLTPADIEVEPPPSHHAEHEHGHH
jgi:hypothetical protein